MKEIKIKGYEMDYEKLFSSDLGKGIIEFAIANACFNAVNRDAKKGIINGVMMHETETAYAKAKELLSKKGIQLGR